MASHRVRLQPWLAAGNSEILQPHPLRGRVATKCRDHLNQRNGTDQQAVRRMVLQTRGRGFRPLQWVTDADIQQHRRVQPQASSISFAFAQFFKPCVGVAHRLIGVIPMVGTDSCTKTPGGRRGLLEKHDHAHLAIDCLIHRMSQTQIARTFEGGSSFERVHPSSLAALAPSAKRKPRRSARLDGDHKS